MTRFLLVMLLVQAYVPVGFMPASGTPFLVELCPDAAPMPAAMSMDIPMNMAVPNRTSTPLNLPAPTRMSTRMEAPAPMRIAMSIGTPMDIPIPTPMVTPMDVSTPTRMAIPAHHHRHSDTHHQFQTCPFGSAPAAGPVAQFVVTAPPAPIASDPSVSFEPLRLGARLERAHQPRGPPSLA